MVEGDREGGEVERGREETRGAKRPDECGAMDVEEIERSWKGRGRGGGSIELSSMRKEKGTEEEVVVGRTREVAVVPLRRRVPVDRDLTLAAIISAAVEEGPWVRVEVDVQVVTAGEDGTAVTCKKGLVVPPSPSTAVRGDRRSASYHPSPVSSLHCTLRFFGDGFVGRNDTGFLGDLRGLCFRTEAGGMG